jgi:hypothetical protein
MVELSFLRAAGIAIGLVLIAVSYLRLRSYRGDGSSGGDTLLFAGLVVLGLGFFPSFVNVPAELISMADIKGGRLITLLLLAVVFLFMSVLWNRHKIAYVRKRLNSFMSSSATEKFRHEYVVTGKVPDDSDLWAVIPALDEAGSIGAVLKGMPSEIFGNKLSVMVVDDGSTDGTGQIARDCGCFVLTMPIASGGGMALKTGFSMAIEMGAKSIITLDSDGQNDPHELESVFEPIIKGEADVVIGSRMLGVHEHTALARSIGVPFFNAFLSLLLGKKLTDCASNYRAFTAKVLQEVELIQEQYHTTELLIEACKRGYRIEERPITFKRRTAGVTKKATNFFYGFWFLRTIIKTYLR